MARELQVLSPEDARHFVEKGYVRVKGCVDPALAKRWTDEAYGRLGYDPEDRSTWTKDIVWMDRHNTAAIRDISPRGWAALCDVTGGEERIDHRIMEIESQHFTTIDSTEWSDAFVVNFRRGADKPWVKPSVEAGGWHKEQAMSLAEAFRCFTLDAAWAAHQEQAVGSLEKGKWADFIITDRDLFKVPAEDIGKMNVLETWVGGKQVYRK